MPKNFQLTSIIPYLRSLGTGSVDLHLNNDTGIATIILNNPTKMNAISGKLVVEFYEAITELEEWTCGKAVIIYGAGDCFCSGGDLKVKKQYYADHRYAEVTAFLHYIGMKLMNLPLVTVSFVHGHGAIGAGAEIAVTTDFCFLHPESNIFFKHARLGTVTVINGEHRLCERFGRNKALEILLEARPIKAKEALQMGLVHGICDDAKEVESILAKKLQFDYQLIRSMKKILLTTDPNEHADIAIQLNERYKKTSTAQSKL